MYNNYFREGMFISFKDGNIDAKITIVIDQIFPCVVKGRIVKIGKRVKMSSKNYNFYCIYFSTIFAEVK